MVRRLNRRLMDVGQLVAHATCTLFHKCESKGSKPAILRDSSHGDIEPVRNQLTLLEKDKQHHRTQLGQLSFAWQRVHQARKMLNISSTPKRG
jgi:hypothetical protein